MLGELLNLGDVPAGVVVGEDRLRPIRRRAGGVQVVGGREDRIPRVIRIRRRPRLCRVRGDGVLGPCAGLDLHPPDRACARDRQVAPEVGLDVVDRRQIRPPVRAQLEATGRLVVDHQQVRRDPRRAAHADRGTSAALGLRAGRREHEHHRRQRHDDRQAQRDREQPPHRSPLHACRPPRPAHVVPAPDLAGAPTPVRARDHAIVVAIR